MYPIYLTPKGKKGHTISFSYDDSISFLETFKL